MEPTEWPQFVIDFADRRTAEEVAGEHLRPELEALQGAGDIGGWSFIRKTPSWRLRYPPQHDLAAVRLAQLLGTLLAEGRIMGWTAGIHEPEVFAFGGTAGMDVAHELAHRDSQNILDYLAGGTGTGRIQQSLGRREAALLLCSVLLRSAGQDWYEQGDVWARVVEHRPTEQTSLQVGDLDGLRAAVFRLITVDAGPSSALVEGGSLSALAFWSAAFGRAGQRLAELTRTGALERGLRAVLTHHVLFAWNRLGLSLTEQNTLATLAKEAVMQGSTGAASAVNTNTKPTTLTEVDTDMTEDTVNTDERAARMRNGLIDQLRDQGTIRTAPVEAALRATPRHLFVPTVPLAKAYADDAVYTKHDGSGASISAASQPTIVAMMLEQLEVKAGQRILEIGAGTGYNAGLLAHLVGDDGHVVTMDVDDDIAEGARSGLAAAEVGNVEVILGDGAVGYAAGAPYDRIIATVGAWDMPLAWLNQLAPCGRLVVPLRLRGSVSRSIVFERDGNRWRSRSSEMSTFMPLRGGIADDPRRFVQLTPDGAVTIQFNSDQVIDAELLADVLRQPRSEAWTGVLFGGAESFEWLDLWLACTMNNALSRMTTDRSATDAGLVTPQFGWGAMATADKGNLAYLTLRPAGTTGTGASRYEVGVVGHGPGGDEIVSQVADQVRTWDSDHRSQSVQFEIQPAGVPDQLTGQFVFATPRNQLAVSWR